MRPIEALSALLGSARYRHKTLADGSGVVVDTADMRVLSLNRTGMFVLDQIAGGATRRALLEQRLIETFEVDRDTARRDLEELLRDLDRHLTDPSRP